MENHTDEQFDAMLEEGIAAFFEVIARHNPQCTTGDLSPVATIRFYDECQVVAEEWIEGNTKSAPLKKFYVTYGNNLIGKYSVVEAENYWKAREIVFEKIGRFFAFIYSDPEFSGQIEKFDLKEIPLQPMEV